MRVERDKLALSLGPGAHAIMLQWQEARGMDSVLRVPQVGLGRGAANASVRVELPAERWLLWASGPAWGPAILFWGYLLVALGAALLLSRIGLSPLRAHQWMLLALGLTQLPAAGALCVAGWFFALAYRSRSGEQPRWLHNLGQVLLVCFTFAALSCLYVAVHAGLLLQPDMQVAGAGSYGSGLRWYVDRIDAALPTPLVISAPLWAWRLCMLAWSLWLAASLVRWLPWAFGCFKHGGLWKSAPPKPPRPPRASPPPSAAAPPASMSTPT
jgi:hypothetical protein